MDVASLSQPACLSKSCLSYIIYTKQCAHLTVYWPGIDNDIENVFSSKQCQDHFSPNHNKLILLKPTPSCQAISRSSSRLLLTWWSALLNPSRLLYGLAYHYSNVHYHNRTTPRYSYPAVLLPYRNS